MNANHKNNETTTARTCDAPVQYPHWIDPRDLWSSGCPWRPGFPRFFEAGPHRPPCLV